GPLETFLNERTEHDLQADGELEGRCRAAREGTRALERCPRHDEQHRRPVGHTWILTSLGRHRGKSYIDYITYLCYTTPEAHNLRSRRRDQHDRGGRWER